jgi:hypothetical protein
MIVNDMNSCIVISDHLSVKGAGSSLRGGGTVELGMEFEEQKQRIPKRRQTGGGAGHGGADIWSGVTL